MATYQAESFLRSQTRQKVDITTLPPFALKTKKVPTLTSGLLTLSPNTVNEEIVEYSGKDDVNLTITVVKRGINPSSQTLTTDGAGAATGDYNNSLYMKSHISNSSIRGDVNHIHIAELAGIAANNTFTGSNVFSKSLRVPVYADATARDAAITSPSNGMVIYNTALGILQQYIGGAWADNASGTVVNASTTVAGKVELATDDEIVQSASTGGTGASLVISPEQLNTHYSMGDGSDGNVTISINTTLTRDMFYNNLTVNTGVNLDAAGYAVHVAGTLTLTGTAKIIRNGNNGTNAALTVAGTGGAALATGTCGVCLGGKDGGTGVSSAINGNAGAAGTAVATSYATTGNSVAGGAGGTGQGGTLGGIAGASASHTRGPLYNTLLNFAKAMAGISIPARGIIADAYGGLASSGSGGAGGGGTATTSGGGGGSGGNGGNIFIFANALAGTGTIEARGGNGGNGGNAGAVNDAGGGGGGGGGCGGIVFLVYRSGTPFTTTLTGGTGGTGGAKVGTGTVGAAGGTGTTGTAIVINV